MTLDDVQHQLGERVKELTALHRMARILQQHERTDEDIMTAIVVLLPEAWQYPAIAAARIHYWGRNYTSPGFEETPWMLRSDFGTAGEVAGEVAVAYLVEPPGAREGPFLAEERELIDSLAEMLGAHLEARLAHAEVLSVQRSLAALVDERTAALRRLASEQTLAEARQRREIATDLHDHVGQALAHMKQRVRSLQGNAVFSGQAEDIEVILRLLDMTILYTRNLTAQISPPVLYELGLEPALDWLAEQMRLKHGFDARLTSTGSPRQLPEAHQVFLYQAARELLANSAAHSGAPGAAISLEWADREVRLTVADAGRGLDPSAPQILQPDHGFGLFSIRERLKDMGGTMTLTGAPGAGCAVALRVPTLASTSP